MDKTTIIRLNKNHFTHIEGKSYYNHNYYELNSPNSNTLLTILEICKEDFNFYEYFIIQDNQKVFLGCSDYSFDDKEILEIDLGAYFT